MLKPNTVRYVSRETKAEILAGMSVIQWVQVSKTDTHPERESFVVSADKGLVWPGRYKGGDNPLEILDAMMNGTTLFGEVDALEGSVLDLERLRTTLPFDDGVKNLTPEEKAKREAQATRKLSLQKKGRAHWKDVCLESMKGDPRNLDSFITPMRGRYGN